MSANAKAHIDYVAKQYNHQSFILPYREANFCGETDTVNRIVILLHSRHSCGNVNDAHLTADGVKMIEKYLDENKLNATFIVPQCPVGREWNERKPQNGSYMTEILAGLINEYKTILTDAKIYIFGTSMGGSGVWRIVNDNPDLFTAAMPAVSVPRDIEIENLLETPLYVVVGSDDRMVSPSKVKSVLKKVNKKGGETKLVILDWARHGDACRLAISKDALDWMFSH